MFSFNHPVQIHFGDGIFSELNDLLSDYSYKKYVLVVSNSQIEYGVAELIKSQIGEFLMSTVTDIEPNPTIGNVERIIGELKYHDADAVIAVGGGSTMDAAKAAAASYLQEVDTVDLLEHKNFTNSLPVIAIPTTSGSGSEVTPFSIISNKSLGLKVPLTGPGLYPKAAIVDPELTLTCPAEATAVSGIDVFCHALDSLGSVKQNPLSDALSIRALQLAFDNVLTVYHEPGNKRARHNMSLASMMAGVAFSQTGTSGAHALSYYLTSRYDIPHGEACAFTMDDWYVINASANPGLEDYAKLIGFESAPALAGRFNELKQELGLSVTFDDLDIPRDDIGIIAEEGLRPANMQNNIAQLSKDKIARFLREK